MKRNTIETIVLIVGVVVIAIALFFMFGRGDSADPSRSLFITNLVFSFGFLIYIIYSIMATNSMNREIRALNKHIAGLKHEIEKYKKQLSVKDATIKEQQHLLDEKEQQIAEQQTTIGAHTQSIDELNRKIAKLESDKAG